MRAMIGSVAVKTQWHYASKMSGLLAPMRKLRGVSQRETRMNEKGFAGAKISTERGKIRSCRTF